MIKKLKQFFAGVASLAVAAAALSSGQVVAVSQQAVDHSPVIVSLGEAVDPATGAIVEGFKVIHYKKGHVKPEGVGSGKKGGGGGQSTCYAFLANGAKWNNVEDYIVDPTNNVGLLEQDVYNLMAAGVAVWESQTSGDVFGTQSWGLVDGADFSSPDGLNEVLFGDAGGPGVIAVTIVWGVFRGPIWQRGLVEWDMVFDEGFGWNTDGNPSDMDFLNIAVHELGHALGLGHPSDSCAEETMYRYADYGETKKRDLNTGDIQGVQALYGN